MDKFTAKISTLELIAAVKSHPQVYSGVGNKHAREEAWVHILNQLLEDEGFTKAEKMELGKFELYYIIINRNCGIFLSISRPSHTLWVHVDFFFIIIIIIIF